MHRFWETSIAPALGALKPETIIEIGSDYGLNTVNLLDLCGKCGCKLHVIDPLPKYDAGEWQRRYGERLAIHQDLSLNVLPRVGRFDAVLIDGDHNWYTVVNELRLIERCSEQQGQPFPLVMVHDIGWPYARRDLYYEPENIPLAYRKPYKRRGMHPASGGLLEEGGYNGHLDNAIYENELQNGVLTAVEDFLAEIGQQVDFLQVPGFHGLGILASRKLRSANRELDRVLGLLEIPSLSAEHLKKIESARLDLDILLQERAAASQNSESEGGG